MIREQAQPHIDLYGPKFKLDAIEFESLTLGSLPPTFVGTPSSPHINFFESVFVQVELVALAGLMYLNVLFQSTPHDELAVLWDFRYESIRN